MSRDLALRAMVAAVEANNETLRQITNRLDTIDTNISTLIDTVAEHIAGHYREGQ